MSVIHLSDDSFQKDVIESDIPVLVDFWAPWCMPCQMLGPVIEELAVQYEGHLKVCKLNVDEASSTSQKYGVSSIPEVKIFKKGEVITSITGFRQKEDYESQIKEVLAS